MGHVEDAFTARYNSFLQTLESEAKDRDQQVKQLTNQLKGLHRTNEVSLIVYIVDILKHFSEYC